MKTEGARAASSQKPFWKCILERYQQRRRLIRPRVPLVFFRAPGTTRSVSQTILSSCVVRSPLQLQIQLSWPSLVKAYGPKFTVQHFNHAAPREKHSPVSPTVNPKAVLTSDQTTADQKEKPEQVPSGATRVPEATTPVLYHRDDSGSASTIKTTHHNHTNTHVVERTTDRVFSKTSSVTPPPVGIQQQSLSPLVKPVSTPARTTIQREFLHRHAFSHEFRGSFESVTRRLLSVKSQPLLLTKPLTDARSSTAGVRSGRYVPPAQREFLTAPAPREDREQIPAVQQPSPPVQRAGVAPPQPAIDVGRLSEEVYRHIQRKIRIERERRGL